MLDCAYHAGRAFAEIGKPDKALPQLRFFVQNADPAGDANLATQIRDARFVLAQMLVAAGHPHEALTELKAIRPLIADAYGAHSAQVRNLDKRSTDSIPSRTTTGCKDPPSPAPR